MRSWRWWLGRGSVPLWLSAFLLVWSGANVLASRFLARELDAIRSSGHPVLPAQMVPTPVPESENAAPLYLTAFAMVEGFPKEYRSGPLNIFWENWQEETELKSVHGGWVRQNDAVLKILRRAFQRSKCRFPIDYSSGSNADVPSLLGSQWCANLLVSAARLAHERGDSAEADFLIAAALRMGMDLVKEDFTLILTMIGIADFNIGFSAFQGFISAGGTPGPHLRRLVSSMRPGQFRQSVANALISERACCINQFKGHLSAESVPLDVIWNEYGSPSTHPVLWNIYSSPPARPILRWHLGQYCRSMQTLINAASDASDQRPLRSGFTVVADNTWNVIERVFLLVLPSTIRAGVECDIRIDLLQSAIEAVDLAKERGEWPDSWLALEARRDRFNGQPLKVKREGRRLRIYSVGRDLKDDGGEYGSYSDIAIDMTLRYDSKR